MIGNARKRTHDGTISTDRRDPQRTEAKRQQFTPPDNDVQFIGERWTVTDPAWRQQPPARQQARSQQQPRPGPIPAGYGPRTTPSENPDWYPHLGSSQCAQHLEQPAQQGRAAYMINPFPPTPPHSIDSQQWPQQQAQAAHIGSQARREPPMVAQPAQLVGFGDHIKQNSNPYTYQYGRPSVRGPSVQQPSRTDFLYSTNSQDFQATVAAWSSDEIPRPSLASPQGYTPNLCPVRRLPDSATPSANRQTRSPTTTARQSNSSNVAHENRFKVSAAPFVHGDKRTVSTSSERDPSAMNGNGFRKPSVIESTATAAKRARLQAQNNSLLQKLRECQSFLKDSPPANSMIPQGQEQLSEAQRPYIPNRTQDDTIVPPSTSTRELSADSSSSSQSPSAQPSSPPPRSDIESVRPIPEVFEPLPDCFVPGFSVLFSNEDIAFLKSLEGPIGHDNFSNLGLARSFDKEAYDDFKEFFPEIYSEVQVDTLSAESTRQNDTHCSNPRTEAGSSKVTYAKEQRDAQEQQERSYRLMLRKNMEEGVKKAKENGERAEAAQKEAGLAKQLRVAEGTRAQEPEETPSKEAPTVEAEQQVIHTKDQPQSIQGQRQDSLHPETQDQRVDLGLQSTQLPLESQQQPRQQQEQPNAPQPTAVDNPSNPKRKKRTPKKKPQQDEIQISGPVTLTSLLKKREEVQKKKWEWVDKEDSSTGLAKRNATSKIRECVRQLDRIREFILIMPGGEMYTND
ncbi:hypothetical protein K458DRAFT_389141 [Lentithecium fluviatile CBS 122367]|uniref:Uncharacterized protein n=1 Tax=Lentithecium fluviatile CBS 122367 TaxID=1168545 RepID=A0A6G1J194_9PLEO|nr:hypothetical protein K458DRAFT_389141 [Lentithecium fluviatile CBS 122367]